MFWVEYDAMQLRMVSSANADNGLHGSKKDRYRPFILDVREGKRVYNGNEGQEFRIYLFTYLFSNFSAWATMLPPNSE